LPILVQVLAAAYDQKSDSHFSKSTDRTLDQKSDSHFIKAESSSRVPEEEEPPTADPLPDSEIDEIAASFKTPPPRERRTAEQVKAGIGKALETFARNGDGRAGVADPTKAGDAWADEKLIAAFCAVSKQPRQTVKPSSLRDWPNQFKAWASTWEDAAPTPQETYECMKGITQSEKDWKDFESPRQPSFWSTMDIMLARLRAGEPWDAEGRVGRDAPQGGNGNGGASTGRNGTPPTAWPPRLIASSTSTA